LREKYDIFPQEIYYCLSKAKIQEYKACWSQKDGLWSSNDDDSWTGSEETKKGPLERKVEKLQRELEKKNQEDELNQRKLNDKLLMALME
ncbi:hypothetical protein BGZ52_006435, partial [Haplosporangium bisporale]